MTKISQFFSAFWNRWTFNGLIVALFALALGWQSSAQVVVPDTFDLRRIQSATVLIMQAQSEGSNLIVTCIGTGTLVSRDGLILTNAHHVVQSEECPGDTIVIAITSNPDEPPTPEFRADIEQFNIGVDLALLRITRAFDGRLLDRSKLALPFVGLADASSVDLDDTIFVVGYPGIGDDPVSIVQGTITAFTAEPSGGERSWLKTSASIPGTMSGGGAYNRQGELIGIPTTAPITNLTFGSNCQPIQDTNDDGSVNENDVCIPVSGFINALRPADFARPLIRAASLRLNVEPLGIGGDFGTVSGIPAFRNLFFSPAVIEGGQPSTVVSSLPTGVDSLYLFFDYENMTPETVYELRVSINGSLSPIFSLAPVRWSGGRNGTWYIGSSGQRWPDGVYEFRLFINGTDAGTARITIGGAAEPKPSISNITFGIEDINENILGNGFVLPTGNIAAARFIHRNIPEGSTITYVWYYNGGELRRVDETWNGPADGARTTRIEATNGLFPGNYRLEIYLDGRLSARSEFVVAGAQEGVLPVVFGQPYFAAAENPVDALVSNPITSLTNRVDKLYVVFDWQRIAPGTLWTMRWSVDGNVFFERTLPWNNTESGTGFVTQLFSPEGLPDGTYQMDLFINGFQLASSSLSIGIGQLPIDRFTQAGGIQLRGEIVDGETKQGIPGVTFIMLTEEFSVSDFEWLESQIFAMATTDSSGRFAVDRPLQPEVPYSIIIAAEGYLPISADGVEVSEDGPNPIELYIELTRD